MKKKFTKITDLMALLVFAAFAVCVLLVLLYGARSYRNVVRRGEESFRERTAVQYVSMRVRQAERVTVTEFGGCRTLAFHEQIDDAAYVTRLYCYDDYLRELFCAEQASLPPEAGEKIMPAESLQLSVEDRLLTVTVDGQVVKLSLRGKGEDLP